MQLEKAAENRLLVLNRVSRISSAAAVPYWYRVVRDARRSASSPSTQRPPTLPRPRIPRASSTGALWSEFISVSLPPSLSRPLSCAAPFRPLDVDVCRTLRFWFDYRQQSTNHARGYLKTREEGSAHQRLERPTEMFCKRRARFYDYWSDGAALRGTLCGV